MTDGLSYEKTPVNKRMERVAMRKFEAKGLNKYRSRDMVKCLYKRHERVILYSALFVTYLVAGLMISR